MYKAPVPPSEKKVLQTKDFQAISELTAFYNFIQEHGLRREAHMILSGIMNILRKKTKKKSKKIQ